MDSNVKQVIMVDNASSDESRRIGRSFENVEVIENSKNEGFGAACNRGVTAVDDDVTTLMFLNPDTRFEDTLVNDLHEFLQRNPQYGAVGPLQVTLETDDATSRPSYNAWTRKAVRCLGIYPPDQTSVKPMPEEAFGAWLLAQKSNATDVEYVNGAALAIRKQLFEACGGFDSGYFLYFEEVDLCRRARRLGYRVALVHDLLVKHAWGGHAEGDRLRSWLTSKYRYMLTDTSLSPRVKLQVVARHLVNDIYSALLDREFRTQLALALSGAIRSLAVTQRHPEAIDQMLA